ncbi:uncharacterized protein LOC125034084 [Penaeus chinensis]|uniref:uncharacterized protein LOC125034084 n=1 Tax=Penaeus chinensis TaxID=139456 RepID=UPI001FB57418|nr:uncharacterized protein LOC125034084 [Penaeus chinensis]
MKLKSGENLNPDNSKTDGDKKDGNLTPIHIECTNSKSEPPPLLEEIKEAIKDLKNGKSPGADEATAELIKNGGPNIVAFYHKLHSSKILLKEITRRIQNKLKDESAKEQTVFRAGRSTRNQILNLKMVIEKNREHGKDLFICFIAYTKAFDTVAHDILWENMHDMGFHEHIILLLKAMYDKQKAADQSVSGHQITNLRYADDAVLIAGSMEELQDLVDRVRQESEKSGFLLNAKKTKGMKIRRKITEHDETNIKINNASTENVKQFTYLGVVLKYNYDDSVEIKRRLSNCHKGYRGTNKHLEGQEHLP